MGIDLADRALGYAELSSSFCPYVGHDSGWRELCLDRSSWLWGLELGCLSSLLVFVSDRSSVYPSTPADGEKRRLGWELLEVTPSIWWA